MPLFMQSAWASAPWFRSIGARDSSLGFRKGAVQHAAHFAWCAVGWNSSAVLQPFAAAGDVITSQLQICNFF
jgi:hypothetical protein